MKITICGSMKFAKEMLEIEKELKKMGHEPILPLDTRECVKDPTLNQNVGFCVENDIIRDHLRKIKESDAILVLNLKKGRIRGYVGSSTLMEMGFAHFLNKEIYLFDRVPKLPCSVEIRAMKPKVLYRDLKAFDNESQSGIKWDSGKRYSRVHQQVFLGVHAPTNGLKKVFSAKRKAKSKFRGYRNKILSCYDITRYLG